MVPYCSRKNPNLIHFSVPYRSLLSAGVITKTGRAGTEALRCDVVVGSALVYSPHHACVADVLSHAFAEGGCRAAYIVQLSTRQALCASLALLISL